MIKAGRIQRRCGCNSGKIHFRGRRSSKRWCERLPLDERRGVSEALRRAKRQRLHAPSPLPLRPIDDDVLEDGLPDAEAEGRRRRGLPAARRARPGVLAARRGHGDGEGTSRWVGSHRNTKASPRE